GAPSGHVQLSVRVSGSGHVTSTPPGVSCPGTCSAVFDAGSSLQLAATPDDGFDFAGWSGACSGRGACSLTMTAAESVAASFTADLSSSGTCLDVHDTHDVTLDCAGHSVGGQPALNMTDVDRFSVTNCTFVSTGAVGVVTLLRTSNGTFASDTFGTTFVNVVRGLDLRIDHNTFNGSYQQGYSKRVVFSNNSMVSQTRGSAFSAALVVSQFGSDNRMVDNVIDGRWDGVRTPLHQTETDDGIDIGDESGDTISGNTIANVFDCGIETSGV